jgi:hypothetical protein
MVREINGLRPAACIVRTAVVRNGRLARRDGAKKKNPAVPGKSRSGVGP